MFLQHAGTLALSCTQKTHTIISKGASLGFKVEICSEGQEKMLGLEHSSGRSHGNCLSLFSYPQGPQRMATRAGAPLDLRTFSWTKKLLGPSFDFCETCGVLVVPQALSFSPRFVDSKLVPYSQNIRRVHISTAMTIILVIIVR